MLTLPSRSGRSTLSCHCLLQALRGRIERLESHLQQAKEDLQVKDEQLMDAADVAKVSHPSLCTIELRSDLSNGCQNLTGHLCTGKDTVGLVIVIISP